MDFKALRAAKNKKAQGLINSSGGKVDSSDWTPDEPLKADVKTGMRPISRRAFKAGGKVDGDEAKSNLSRTPRGTVGLANTNQRVANEERDGEKHIGGFARGGRNMKKAAERDIGENVEGEEMPSFKAKSVGRKALKEMPTSELRKKMGSNRNMERPPSGLPDMQDLDDRENDPRKFKKGGRTGKNNGGPSLNQYGKPITQADLDRYASTTEQVAPSKLAPKTSIRPMTRSDAEKQRMLDAENDGMPMKRGGKAEKFEGSAKDEMQDKKLAAKRGMSMKEWEASAADEKHDEQKSMKGLKHGGKACHEGCTCKACGGRTARATGGRTKGKTNIVINVMPHTAAKPAMGMQPPMPMPPVGGPPPMGGGMPPPPMHLPPGLGAAMAGASGPGPMPPSGPPPGAGPMPPMMARKSGGKVYPKMKFGAGSGKGRLEKIEEYGTKG
jgi:hypothetical protein